MTAPARTQKQRREEAEAALLDAAAELVAEQGLRALTLARVGEHAGYSGASSPTTSAPSRPWSNAWPARPSPASCPA